MSTGGRKTFQQMDAPAGTQISLEPTGKMAEDRTVLVTVTVEEVEAKVVTVNVLMKVRPCAHKMINYVKWASLQYLTVD